jgi:bifunctional DNase/RNase
LTSIDWFYIGDSLETPMVASRQEILDKSKRKRRFCRGFRVFYWADYSMKKHFPLPVFTIALFCLVLGLGLSGRAVGKVSPLPSLAQKDLMEVKVYRLIADPNTMQPVVLLADPAGDRAIPIWIGPTEAGAIQAEMEGTPPLRPMTHDLLERVIQKMNGTVKRVIITHQKESIYYAVIVIEKDRALFEIDARPSDSIVMALKFKAPIFIAKSLFRERALRTGEQGETEDLYGLSLQEMTPMLAESFGFKKGTGIVVSDVKDGSPAEKQGFQRGDIIVEAGPEKIMDVSGMKNALAKIKAPTKIKIFRKGAFTTLTFNPVN